MKFEIKSQCEANERESGSEEREKNVQVLLSNLRLLDERELFFSE